MASVDIFSEFTTLSLPPSWVELHASTSVEVLANPKRVFKRENPIDEYALDILLHSKEQEHLYRVDPGYLTFHRDLTVMMRTVLVNWMYEVAEYFRLLPETFSLTVQVIDRFLDAKTKNKKQVDRSSLQLIGCASMLIASKVEEIYALPVADLVAISNDAFLPVQLRAMEKSIMETLGWNVTSPTSVYFLKNFWGCEDETSKKLANYLVELASGSYSILEFVPSTVAASSLYLTRLLMHRQRVGYECKEYISEFAWPQELVDKTGYTLAEIKVCAERLNSLLEGKIYDKINFAAVTVKWSAPNFSRVGCVSALKNL